jgi:hypothetical protein
MSFCDLAKEVASDTQPADLADIPSSDHEITPLRTVNGNKSAVLGPWTPMTGNKRRANGDLVIEPRTSATKTPGSVLRRKIGATAAVDFSLSQIFEATQVETSPANELRSDPIFERPSPQGFVHGSSPPPGLRSSPPKPAEETPSGRITSSQMNTRIQVPASSQAIAPSSVPRVVQPNQESGLTHLSQGDREQLGSETQGALGASSPPHLSQYSPIATTPKRRPSFPPSQTLVQRSSNRDASGDNLTPNLDGADDVVPATQEPGTDTATQELVTDTGGLAELFPDRVLAFWGGKDNACFPATVVGNASSGPDSLEVVFDNGSSGVVSAKHAKWVFKLALQCGDIVRVDMPNMKGKNFVVQGVKDKVQPGNGSGTQEMRPTDVFGHQTVVVRPKARRSMTADESLELVELPISKIKIGHLEFHLFQNRQRDVVPATEQSAVRTSVVPTPAGRKSADSPAIQHGLFENMAFAVTLHPKSELNREDIERLIKQHGGRPLSSGFEELFDLPAALFSPHSATGTSTRTALRPTASAQGLGFTALIADAHSRRPKHVQALALNLPILHHAWLRDSIAAGAPLAWGPYLLPAGVSARLDRTVRSRVLAPYGPRDEEARLDRVLERRGLLLDGARVLAVVGRADERSWAYLFLCVALGAAEIARAKDLRAAKARLEEEWDWVYADVGVDKAVGSDKVRAAFGQRVLDDEIVVQSLIWGSLVV